MIVVLSWSQLQAARYWATPAHRELLTENREHTKAGHECAMPAVAWRVLADRLMREAFHPSGRHRKTRNQRDGVPATRAALQKIEAGLAQLAMHPALRNEAVAGNQAEVLIVWPDESYLSIFPVPDVEPVYFLPMTSEHEQLGTVTRWQRRDSVSRELMDALPEAFLDPVSHQSWFVVVAEDDTSTA